MADHLTRALLGLLKKSPEEDTMYAATQEAMTAEITYRRHRLTDEFRRGVRTNTRRWGRPRQ